MSTARTWRRLAVLVSSMALSAATLSGCGGDGGADSAGSIRVIQSVPDSVTEVGVQAAQSLGTYKKCAPDIKVDRTVGTAVEQAVAANSADIGMGSSNSVVAAIAGGLKAKIIGSSMDGWDQALIMNPDTTATSIQGLKPSIKLGITRFGSAGHYASLRMAQALGWKSDDYKFVTVGDLDSLRAGLKSGLFDGFVWGPDTGEAMEASGDGKMIGQLSDLIGPNVQIFYFASDQILKDRPDEVKKFMDCTFQGVKTLKGDSHKATSFFKDDQKKDATVIPGLIGRDLAFASSDGSVSQDQMKGVLDAVHQTIPDQASLTLDDINGMYQYWGDL